MKDNELLLAISNILFFHYAPPQPSSEYLYQTATHLIDQCHLHIFHM